MPYPCQIERAQFGSNPGQLRLLVSCTAGASSRGSGQESTAQYWKPVWGVLEGYLGNRSAREREGIGPMSGNSGASAIEPWTTGCKNDFADAESPDLILSFVPDPQQRL